MLLAVNQKWSEEVWGVKVLVWLVVRKSIPTRDVLAKRNWESSETKCSFCDYAESIRHLFFESAIAKYVWGVVRVAIGLTEFPNCRSI